MGDKTRISWADATWNPVVGCARISEGCKNCYALKLQNRRYKANTKQAVAFAGLLEQGERKLRSYEGWADNVRRVGSPPGGWAARARELGVRMPLPAQYDQPFSQVQLLPDRLDQPLHWRNPRRIFVCSMSDLFHEAVPDEFIDQVFARMRATRQHTFLVLTKRPERMRGYIGTAAGETSMRVRHMFPSTLPKHWYHADNWRWPLSNVHLGVSVENQHWADIRTPILLDIPAAKRFVSVEPMLEAINLRRALWGICPVHDGPSLSCNHGQCPATTRIDAVICGGESGPGYRPMDPAWARDLREQCRAAGVSFFMKQRAALRPGVPMGDPILDNCKEFPA
mgnify:CR=1 FL=1